MNKVIIIVMLLISNYLFSRGDREGNSNGEVTLFSEFRGKITLEEEPLFNVKLTRTYPKIGSTDQIVESVYTDINGNYHFNEATGKLGIMRFLPHEAVIHQKIEAEFRGEKYLLWYTCKRNYDPLGELKYYKYDPILNSKMSKAYNEGYIRLDCDLRSKEEIVQRVNDDILGFISITDLNFPYEAALKEYAALLVSREDEFIKEISNWFKHRPDYFDRLTDGTESWSDMERESLTPYFNTKIESVERVDFSDYVSLDYYEEDYIYETQRLTVSGGIILNLINGKGEKLQARVWLSSAQFSVNKDEVELLDRDHYFVINSSNIDPRVVD